MPALSPAKKRSRQAHVSNTFVNLSDVEGSQDQGLTNNQPPIVEENTLIQGPIHSSLTKSARSPPREQTAPSAEEKLPPMKERKSKSCSLLLGNKAQRKRIKDLAKVVRDHNDRPIPHLNKQQEEEQNDVNSEPDNHLLSPNVFLFALAVRLRTINQAIKRKEKTRRGPKLKFRVRARNSIGRTMLL